MRWEIDSSMPFQRRFCGHTMPPKMIGDLMPIQYWHILIFAIGDMATMMQDGFQVMPVFGNVWWLYVGVPSCVDFSSSISFGSIFGFGRFRDLEPAFFLLPFWPFFWDQVLNRKKKTCWIRSATKIGWPWKTLWRTELWNEKNGSKGTGSLEDSF